MSMPINWPSVERWVRRRKENNMLAWIVYNGSAYKAPMQEQVQLYQETFEKHHITTIPVLNEHLAMTIQGDLDTEIPKPDFVLFWSKDVILAEMLSQKGIPIFNSARAIAISDNKLDTHLALQSKGLSAPKTIPFPMLYPLYLSEPNNIKQLLDRVENLLGYPMVLKEAQGSFGMQVYLAHNRTELEKTYDAIRYKPGLFQEYIASASGVDMRIQVIGNTAVAAMKRINPNDFRSNITSGGHVEKCTMPEEYASLAVKASNALSLDFAGIDILEGPHKEPIICEVNSNAFVKNISIVSGIDVPGLMLTHILGKLESQ